MQKKLDRLLSLFEVQQITGRGRTTLWRMSQAGELCPRKLRGRLGYLESEVERYLMSLPVVGPKPCGAVADNPSAAEE